jgi:hypothetical protein
MTPTVFSTIIAIAPPTPPPPPQPAQVPPTPEAPTYTVVSGDNPTAIAAKLNIPSGARDAWVQQLLSLNGTSANALRVGQVLKLPAASSQPSAQKPPLGEAVGTPPPALLPPELRTTPLPEPVAPANAGTGCASFSTQRVRDWCSRPFSTPNLNCADFAKGTGEATRFTKAYDPLDVNGLDRDKDGKSCEDK